MCRQLGIRSSVEGVLITLHYIIYQYPISFYLVCNEYYFMRLHEYSLYCGPPTKKKKIRRILHVVWACVAKVDTHPRGSPLVQGGLEIPVEVTVTTPYSEKNRAALDKL